MIKYKAYGEIVKMLKKLLLPFLVVVSFCSVLLYVYALYEPEDIVTDISSEYFTIDYANVREYTLNSGESTTHYYFFCSPTKDDCNYVKDTLFKNVENEYSDLKLNEIIEYVDITDQIDRMAMNQLYSDWGISNYPALVSCTNNEHQITINNSLVWDNNSPLSTNDLRNWLAMNNLLNAEYVEPLQTTTN